MFDLVEEKLLSAKDFIFFLCFSKFLLAVGDFSSQGSNIRL